METCGEEQIEGSRHFIGTLTGEPWDYKWKDITKEFINASSELHSGELLHDDKFSLFQAILADPKICAGMIPTGQPLNGAFQSQIVTNQIRKNVSNSGQKSVSDYVPKTKSCWTCDEADCNKVYSRKSHLTRHKTTFHIPGKVRPKRDLPCKFCDCLYSTKKSLYRHCLAKHNFDIRANRPTLPFDSKVSANKKDTYIPPENDIAQHSNETGPFEEDCSNPSQKSVPMSKAKRWKCDVPDCNKVCSTKSHLARHKTTFHIPGKVGPKRDLPCKFCDRLYSTKKSLYRHCLAKHNFDIRANNHIEHTKGINLPPEKDLDQLSNETWPLDAEDRNLIDGPESNNERHKEMAHIAGKGEFVCDLCGVIYPWKKTLYRHNRTKHSFGAEPEKTVYIPPENDAFCTTNQHSNEPTTTTNFEPNPQSTRDLLSYVAEVLIEDRNLIDGPTPRVWCCNVKDCNLVYPSRSSLREHKKNVHIPGKNMLEGDFICKDCNRQYSTRKSLYRHCKEIHCKNPLTGETLPCPVKDRNLIDRQKSTEKSVRKVKISSNTIGKSWPCHMEDCFIVCSSKGSLCRHMKRVHAPGKVKRKRDVLCELCGGGFSCNKRLYLHRRQKHGFDKYIPSTKLNCKCGANVNRMEEMAEHVKIVHGEPSYVYKKEFDNMEQFLAWQAQLEADTGSFFTKVMSATKNRNRASARYRCNRSGSFVSLITESERKRPNRKTKKLGYICCAFMNTYIDKQSGKVNVIYCDHHYGHRNHRILDNIKLPKIIRRKVRDWSKQNVSDDLITEYITDLLDKRNEFDQYSYQPQNWTLTAI